MIRCLTLLPAIVLSTLHADEVKVLTATRGNDAGFNMEPVPPPAVNDAAADAVFVLVGGERDGNGGELAVLHDGKVPANGDEPRANFFFRAGTDGGRISIDLKKPVKLGEINTYSWHTGSRGPQVYKLYAAAGGAEFDPAPAVGVDPVKHGWKLLAEVDTRPEEGEGGGQHAVSIRPASGEDMGSYQHLLFAISRTQNTDTFGNTFFSEIDVIEAGSEPERLRPPEKVVKVYPSDDGKYTYTVDSTLAPDLTEWSETEMMPVVREWYPKIVEMLPSPGYRAPDSVLIEFRDDMGGTPAYAAGNRVALNVGWYRGQLQREAKGAVVHELVHTVQNYWRARARNRNAAPTPGWIVEGIADYVRWFLYEPESKGAEITRRNLGQARYDASYRISANFLDWVIRTHDEKLLQKLNEAAREGRYDEALWKEWTGKPLAELGADWVQWHSDRLQG
jgi:hypothetical protein